MIIKTKQFKDTANAILIAIGVDKNASNLELVTKDNFLFLNIMANQEFYCSKKFQIDTTTDFHAVVDAKTFLSLISGVTTETFDLQLKDNKVIVKVGKSSYKVPITQENESMLTLPIIKPDTKTIEMTISDDVLKSILNVNSKEILKVKNIDVNELQRLYFVDETGCYTFAQSNCINNFTLEKPVKLLLSDKVVKLFKLFDTDVYFSYGISESTTTAIRNVITFETEDTYLAVRLSNDDTQISRVLCNCQRAKDLSHTIFSNHVVVSAVDLGNAVNRLITFGKNTLGKIVATCLPVRLTFTDTELVLQDVRENCEYVTVDNNSSMDTSYSMTLDLLELKTILDTCKVEHITINCGNHQHILINRGPITNILAEIAE